MLTEDGWISSEEQNTNYADSLLMSLLVDFTAEDVEKITSDKKKGMKVYTVIFTDEYLNQLF